MALLCLAVSPWAPAAQNQEASVLRVLAAMCPPVALRKQLYLDRERTLEKLNDDLRVLEQLPLEAQRTGLESFLRSCEHKPEHPGFEWLDPGKLAYIALAKGARPLYYDNDLALLGLRRDPTSSALTLPPGAKVAEYEPPNMRPAGTAYPPISELIEAARQGYFDLPAGTIRISSGVALILTIIPLWDLSQESGPGRRGSIRKALSALRSLGRLPAREQRQSIATYLDECLNHLQTYPQARGPLDTRHDFTKLDLLAIAGGRPPLLSAFRRDGPQTNLKAYVQSTTHFSQPEGQLVSAVGWMEAYTPLLEFASNLARRGYFELHPEREALGAQAATRHHERQQSTWRHRRHGHGTSGARRGRYSSKFDLNQAELSAREAMKNEC